MIVSFSASRARGRGRGGRSAQGPNDLMTGRMCPAAFAPVTRTAGARELEDSRAGAMGPLPAHSRSLSDQEIAIPDDGFQAAAAGRRRRRRMANSPKQALAISRTDVHLLQAVRPQFDQWYQHCRPSADPRRDRRSVSNAQRLRSPRNVHRTIGSVAFRSLRESLNAIVGGRWEDGLRWTTMLARRPGCRFRCHTKGALALHFAVPPAPYADEADK